MTYKKKVHYPVFALQSVQCGLYTVCNETPSTLLFPEPQNKEKSGYKVLCLTERPSQWPLGGPRAGRGDSRGRGPGLGHGGRPGPGREEGDGGGAGPEGA